MSKIEDLVINNHHFYYNYDDSFATSFVSLYFIYKVNKNDVPYLKILLDVLSDSIKEYPNKKEFSNYLGNLYNSTYTITQDFIGNVLFVKTTFGFPNLSIFDDKTKKEVLESAFKTINSTFTNPNFIKNGVIDKEYINKFIDNQRILELRKHNKPTFEMYNNLYQTMYGNSVYGQRFVSYSDRLKKVNYNKFLELYNKLLTYDYFSLYGGNDKLEDIDYLVNKYFNFNNNSIKYTMYPKKIYERINKLEYKIFNKNIDQAHILMRFHSNLKGNKNLYVKDLFNYIFGECFSSDLFLRLREELGLAYDVSSIIEDNSIIVHMGCKLKNVNLAIKEINNIVNSYDKYNKEELENKLNMGKTYFITGTKVYNDSISHIRKDVEYFVLRKKLKNLKKIEKKYNNITIDDIINFSKSLSLMNVFVTKPTSEEFVYEE